LSASFRAFSRAAIGFRITTLNGNPELGRSKRFIAEGAWPAPGNETVHSATKTGAPVFSVGDSVLRSVVARSRGRPTCGQQVMPGTRSGSRPHMGISFLRDSSRGHRGTKWSHARPERSSESVDGDEEERFGQNAGDRGRSARRTRRLRRPPVGLRAVSPEVGRFSADLFASKRGRRRLSSSPKPPQSTKASREPRPRLTAA